MLNYIYSDYKEYNTDTTIKFVVTMNPEKLQKAENEGIHKFFKLHSSIGLTSMVMFIFYYNILYYIFLFEILVFSVHSIKTVC